MGEIQITESICKDKAEKKSVLEIAEKYGLELVEVKRILKENMSIVKAMAVDLKLKKIRKYEGLFEDSVKVLKDILNTSHFYELTDKEGNLVGEKVDEKILKIKKEIATEVVESVGAKKGSGKGSGGIKIANINTGSRQIEVGKEQEVQNILAQIER